MNDSASEADALHALCVSIDVASRAFGKAMELAARALYAGVPATTVETLLRSMRAGNSSSREAAEPPSLGETPDNAPTNPGIESEPPVPRQRQRQRQRQKQERRATLVDELVSSDPQITGKQLGQQVGVSERTAHRLLRSARVPLMVDFVARTPEATVEDVSAYFGGLTLRQTEVLLREVPGISIPRRPI